jgi:hypothetical protein
MSKCVCFLLVVAAFASNVAFAQSQSDPPPLRRVTLYKHGVGYFERQGKVTGDAQVSFLFDAGQMNDVLKSLVVLDRNKGKISSVSFDSTKPMDRRLEEFGLSLDQSNATGLTSLLGQLKGAKVELRAGGSPASGVIVGIEKRRAMNGPEIRETDELIMITESGELRSYELDQIRGIRLLDQKLREDLDQYLSILQSSIHKNLRRLTIAATGQGERELFVSYVVEAPIWKATYRIVLDPKLKPFLQGWALINNVQDEDWNDVTLSLVSGAPVSFIQDLQQPIYKRRPVVGLPEEVSVAPQIPQASINRPALNLLSGSRGGVINGVVTDSQGAVIPGATVRLRQTGGSAEVSVSSNTAGEYTLRGVPTGRYLLIVDGNGFKKRIEADVDVTPGQILSRNITLEVGAVTETVTVSAGRSTFSTDSSMSMTTVSAIRDQDSGVEIKIDTQDIGELFEYRIAHPITIKRNSSALIPILQSLVDGETVSLYNQATREQNPMNALYLSNNTGLTLEGGPMTIIEKDAYAGEALTGRIKPGEKRFITYSVDLGCRVSVKKDDEAEKAFLAEITNGEFRVHYKQTKTTQYTFNNLTDHAKTIYVEHPYDQDEKWRLAKTAKPVETTEDYYRFKVVVAPNANAVFTVNEELPDVNTFALSNLTTANLELFIQSNYLTPSMKQALDNILNQKAEIAGLIQQSSQKQSEISAIMKDQERMRENLRSLGKSEEEKQLLQRYVAKLTQGEDLLERLRAEDQKLKQERMLLDQRLGESIRKLAMEYRLP